MHDALVAAGVQSTLIMSEGAGHNIGVVSGVASRASSSVVHTNLLGAAPRAVASRSGFGPNAARSRRGGLGDVEREQRPDRTAPFIFQYEL